MYATCKNDPNFSTGFDEEKLRRLMGSASTTFVPLMGGHISFHVWQAVESKILLCCPGFC